MSDFRRTLFLLGCISCSVATLLAQTPKKSNTKTAGAKETKPAVQRIPFSKPPVTVYLGMSDIHEGVVPKPLFDSLMRQGLTARDSAGNALAVTEFFFLYKERNLYEDSVGNYYVGVDLLSDVNKGNHLNQIISNSIYERTKPGDTVLFENLLVQSADSNIRRGIPFSIFIGK